MVALNGSYKSTSRNSEPPGHTLQSHRASKATITCKDAAAVRGVPLSNELKSIILTTSNGIIVVHVPGDKYVSLRAVKLALGSAQAQLAAPSVLSELSLTPGTVCAVLDPVWSLRHLISKEVLDLTYVTTNDGTKEGYFVFSPELLLKAEQVQVGAFSRQNETK
jgi:prolyl-tRNA editing enzyme YbaK/EbsC (Cys-tRNA(Pro) deacylase)